MKRNIFYTIVISLFFSACLNSKNNTQETEIIHIDLNENNSEFKNTSLVKRVSYIPLETNKNCLIGSVDKILFFDQKFYVLDNTISKAVFVFSKTGKFLFKAGKQGRGPHEIAIYHGFDVDLKGNIYLGDNTRNKIVMYDSFGNFCKTIHTKSYFEEFSILNENKIALRNISENGQPIINLGIYDLIHKKTENIIPARELYDNYETPRFSNSYFSRSDSNLYYNAQFDDSIYKISGNTISKIIQVNDNLFPPNDILRRLITEPTIIYGSNAYLINIDHIYETTNFITFRYLKPSPTNLFYSKRTKKIITFVSFAKSVFMREYNICGIAEDKVISILQASDIKNDWEEKVLDLKLDSKTEKQLLQFNTTSNPIVCLIDINDF